MKIEFDNYIVSTKNQPFQFCNYEGGFVNYIKDAWLAESKERADRYIDDMDFSEDCQVLKVKITYEI